LAPVLAHLHRAPQRTWSLIITVYGDAIMPRGGSVWLGTLLAFFSALGIGEGVVRTAMSRLAADGWLERSRVGRNSFYRLSETGGRPFAQASRRIYSARTEPWQGFFELFLPEDGHREALVAAGCGAIAPGVWLAPRPVEVEGLRLRAEGDADTLRQLAARAWTLDRLGASYAGFVSTFLPLRAFLADGGTCSDVDAFAARILLIHDYRRIVLRDPLLPAVVLPGDWAGDAARAMCAEIYRAVLPASEAWLDAHGLDERGPLPSPGAVLAGRFGD
jgi:phenylacetic acid degradation operon negative regulatory protein